MQLCLDIHILASPQILTSALEGICGCVCEEGVCVRVCVCAEGVCAVDVCVEGDSLVRCITSICKFLTPLG